MGCWQDLDLALRFRIVRYLPENDLIPCQSVCKSFREPVISLFYNTVEIKDPKTAMLFLQGQLQAIQPKGGLFVNILNITESFAIRQGDMLPPKAMLLFASTCPNVQYIIGDSRHPFFWTGLKDVSAITSWRQLKSIPFQNDYPKEYLICLQQFSKSLTNATIKDLPKDQFPDNKYDSKTLFSYIKALVPNVESIEVYNRKIKNVFELNDLTYFFPNLRHLVLGKGKPKFMANPSRNAVIEIKKRGIEPHHSLELLYIALPKLDFESIQFLGLKFPAVKELRLEYDKVTDLLKKDSGIQPLLNYVLSREKYYLLLPVDNPAVLLDQYYQFFSPVCNRLNIFYRPGHPMAPRKTAEQYSPDVIIQNIGNHSKGVVDLCYHYLEKNDENFLEITEDVFKFCGDKLEHLDIDMSLAYHYTLGSNLMNGFFLDSLIFRYCINLNALRLQHFHLLRCDPNGIINTSIESVYIKSCFVFDGNILYDLSNRLPNLKIICLEACNFSSFDRVLYINVPKTNIEKLTIADSMNQSVVWIRWIEIHSEMQGRKVYSRSEPNSPIFVEWKVEDYEKTRSLDEKQLVIICRSVKAIDISSAQFQIVKAFDFT